jgi:protein-L-isoaspartate(D-aspartate) O-methyltransferase
MLDFVQARRAMVERQLERRGLGDQRVLEAMRQVPRERFVPQDLQDLAYEDQPLPIEAGQTISQPYIVAMMIAAAALRPGDRVLEIGAGSGYAAAVASRIAERVIAVERHAALAEAAAARLAALGYDNVRVVTGDGSLGWAPDAPFDAILVAAAGPAIPQSLKAQLGLGGRLVMPVGEGPGAQRLVKVRRTRAGHYQEDDLAAVSFVPLIGAEGRAPDREPHEGERRRAPEPRSFGPAAR